jgi:hypothetical protein
MRKSNKSIEPYLNYMQMQCVKDHVNVFGKTLDRISIWANISTILMIWGEIFLEKFNLPKVPKYCY